MPRANRHYLPGYIWHITHRCHKKEFLLKFSKDRSNWIRWLHESKKRYGLSILNFIVTSNHVHLLVYDTEKDVIPKSMQLIAGRTGQEYNQRKERKGAFWEDRYHATAVQSGEHLLRCMVYIDLNMVRAGVVKHPSEWEEGGYHEIMTTRKRNGLIDQSRLFGCLGIQDGASYRQLLDGVMDNSDAHRDPSWTENVAVGSHEFVSETKVKLRSKGYGREIYARGDVYELREPQDSYDGYLSTEKGLLRQENAYLWSIYGSKSND